jgi:deazaflavin-dependent oxidoreductase (nitroreductase family)
MSISDHTSDIYTPDPPSGWKRLLWRAPIWLYRLGLGGLMGDHFLLLTHTGRSSGLPRQAVLEIVDRDDENQIYYVVSGFGEKADWYKNIIQNPEATIQVGWKKIAAIAEQVPFEDAVQFILDYAQRHPQAIKTLIQIMGYPLGDTEEDYRTFAQIVPVIGFRPPLQGDEE